nr:MAG TPA: hypothetical protein [Caudoviricetes sp.]
MAKSFILSNVENIVISTFLSLDKNILNFFLKNT